MQHLSSIAHIFMQYKFTFKTYKVDLWYTEEVKTSLSLCLSHICMRMNESEWRAYS